MKKTMILLYLLSFIIILQSSQLVNATSKIIKLLPGGISGTQLIELQKDDQIEGSFSISNLGPYKNTLNGEIQTYEINVKLIFHSNQTHQTIQEYKKTSGGFFNYTAPNIGNISQWTSCSGRENLQNAITPEITFNYEIEPTLSPENQEPLNTEGIIGIILTVIVLGAGVGLFIYLIKKIQVFLGRTNKEHKLINKKILEGIS